MIEQILRNFCDSRYRWLIVISLTLLLCCALLGPLVDDYFHKLDQERELRAELASSQEVSARIEQLESAAAADAAALQELEAETVDAESLNALRKRLHALARESGCTIRKLQVGNVLARPWHNGDNPLRRRPEGAPQAATAYNLERWPVTLTVFGPTASMQTMMRNLHETKMLVHTKSLEMRPEGRTRTNVILDLEMWFFALTQKT